MIYLASVYRKHPGGLDAAWKLACEAAATLIQDGWAGVYSPIVHSHPIAMYGNIDPVHDEPWVSQNKEIMKHCDKLIVWMSEGWRESVGIAEEIEIFQRAEKPVIYMGFTPQHDKPWI